MKLPFIIMLVLLSSCSYNTISFGSKPKETVVIYTITAVDVTYSNVREYTRDSTTGCISFAVRKYKNVKDDVEICGTFIIEKRTY